MCPSVILLKIEPGVYYHRQIISVNVRWCSIELYAHYVAVRERGNTTHQFANSIH
jgi:hypothetical protein